MAAILLHQTHHSIGDFSGIFESLKNIASVNNADEVPKLHLFPEFYLTGYPIQDLCLNPTFIQHYQQLLQDIEEWARTWPKNGPRQVFALGGPRYNFDQQKLPVTIENVVWKLEIGGGKEHFFACVYIKQLLPSYDIFDEKKYFTPGMDAYTFDFEGLHLGLLICEDMWASNNVERDPVKLLKERALEEKKVIDYVIDLSASPYHIGKRERRLERGKEISHFFQNAPFIYLNRVGGEDEILFDGASFIVQGEDVLYQAKSYIDEIYSFTPTKLKPKGSASSFFNCGNYWESLLTPRLKGQNLAALTPIDCSEIVDSLVFALQEYARKNSFDHFVVALSGGLDSGLVLTLVKMALKENQTVHALYMPSIYSSSLSTELAEELCRNLSVPLIYQPIKYLHKVVEQNLKESFGSNLSDLTDQNLQSRIRGLMLYAYSNQTNRMVINTSNKSEIAVGYSTQYGDSVGALSLLGDVYKSEVFQLAHFINQKFGQLIPQAMIDRKPSAELKTGQTDEESLLPYSVLDPILESILCCSIPLTELVNLGFLKNDVLKVAKLYNQSEYKRSQFCPIVKVKAKSFGFGNRVPISKATSFFTF